MLGGLGVEMECARERGVFVCGRERNAEARGSRCCLGGVVGMMSRVSASSLWRKQLADGLLSCAGPSE